MPVLTLSAKPLGRDDKKLVPRKKPKGFILSPSVRKGPWHKCNHSIAFFFFFFFSDCVLEGQTAVTWSAGFGETFKKEEEEGNKKKIIPFPKDHFCFYRETRKDGRKLWREGIQGRWKPASSAAVEIVLKSSSGFRQGCVIDYKCWNLFQ